MNATESLLFNKFFIDFLKQYYIHKKDFVHEQTVLNDMPDLYKHKDLNIKLLKPSTKGWKKMMMRSSYKITKYNLQAPADDNIEREKTTFRWFSYFSY